MYIARRPVSGHYEYSLKESYYEAPYWRSKTVLNLGAFPEKYITYYSEVAFSIDLEEKLEKLGYNVDQWELERLFFRFLNPEAQRIITQFTRPTSIKRKRKEFDLKDIHPFDIKRRLVLKFGISNPGKYMDIPYPFLSELCNKSRDELENYFWDLEDGLKYREKIKYLLVIFDLLYLYPRIKPWELDEIFINNFCKILEDESFRMGLSAEELHSTYFCRYVWMYFDMILFFPVIKKYRAHTKSIYFEASKIFGISLEELEKVSIEDLFKIFRKKAKELHPDRGGSHEKFIQLRKIFEELLNIKKYS
ncbi:MAG: hypothetical protein J7K20_02330 [Thermodesulfobacterium sp.]|nr:hypothetical protein [Thermodesulfobacterium sp.]